jgi:hypothetical protein
LHPAGKTAEKDKALEKVRKLIERNKAEQPEEPEPQPEPEEPATNSSVMDLSAPEQTF